MSASKGRLAGFALLEAIVALTIVGLAAIASMATFGAELRAEERALRTIEARALGEERLSQLRLQPASTLIALPDSLRSGQFEAPYAAYHWEQAAKPQREIPGLFEIEVTVLRSADPGMTLSANDGRWHFASRLFRSRGAEPVNE